MEESAFGRLVAVLFSPGKTFEAIARRPTWVVGIIVLALLGAAVTYVGFTKVDPDSFIEMMREQGREMPADGPSPESMLEISKWAGVIGALLVSPIVYAIMALLFWVSLRMLGSEMDFVRSLSVAIHGSVPLGVAAIIGIPVALGRSEMSMEELQGGQYLMSNLGFLAGDETSAVVRALLTSVDLFSIWCIVLLTIGYRIVARVTRGAALAVTLAVWALGVLLKVAMAAAFS
ncbi:MAG TPA: Yip1 family protein [Thermoanaerobaculia bacterium]|nr:Yip1 family protein [Thermoanaerobaculia bacterium]